MRASRSGSNSNSAADNCAAPLPGQRRSG
jgi:hypothetical protein